MRRFVVWAIAVAALCLAALPVSGAEVSLRVATFRCDVTPPLGESFYSSYQPLVTIEQLSSDRAPGAEKTNTSVPAPSRPQAIRVTLRTMRYSPRLREGTVDEGLVSNWARSRYV